MRAESRGLGGLGSAGARLRGLKKGTDRGGDEREREGRERERESTYRESFCESFSTFQPYRFVDLEWLYVRSVPGVTTGPSAMSVPGIAPHVRGPFSPCIVRVRGIEQHTRTRCHCALYRMRV